MSQQNPNEQRMASVCCKWQSGLSKIVRLVDARSL